MDNNLGFGKLQKPKTIYVENKGTSLWHFWDKEKEQIVEINETTLTGYITGVAIATYESPSMGEEVTKFQIAVKADQQYVIQMGIDTWAAKTAILALKELPGTSNFNPITIEVQAPKSSKKVVFIRIYDHNSILLKSKHEWKRDKNGRLVDDTDWLACIQELINKFSYCQPPTESDSELTEEELTDLF